MVTSDLCGSFVQGEVEQCKGYSQKVGRGLPLWSGLLKWQSNLSGNTQGDSVRLYRVTFNHLCHSPPMPRRPDLGFHPGFGLSCCSIVHPSEGLEPPPIPGVEAL